MTDLDPAATVERRRDTLRALRESAASKTALCERLGVSRSTVDRSVRELSTLGFVRVTADGCRVTVPGRLALDAYDRRTDRVDAIADAAPLLEDIDPGVDIDPAVFDGATLVAATALAPHRPTEYVRDLVTDATHVSVYTARFLDRHASIYQERILDAAMTGSFVVTEHVLDRARETRSDELATSLDLGRVGIRRTDRTVPLTLVLAETPDGPEMGLVVYRDDVPSGFVGNDTAAATRWARDLHERLWSAATPI